MLIAKSDTPGNVDSEWVVVESNRDQATETFLGVAKIATQALTDAGVDDLTYITPLKLSTYIAALPASTASN